LIQTADISPENEVITLRQVIAALVFLGIFFIPFTSWSGISALGEFGREGAFLFFVLAAIGLGIQATLTRKLAVPFRNLLFQVMLLLFLWFVITTILNLSTIDEYYFKGVSGYERFISQFIVLLISGFAFLVTFFNVFRRFDHLRLFYKLRRVFFYSMLIVASYGILEILILVFNMDFLYNILWFYNFFPFTEVSLDYAINRISSVTFEPPALATYLFTVSGWMFSYIITEKGLKRFIPALVTIVLALFSDSRAGLVIIFVQILVFGVLLIKKRKHHQLLIKLLALSTVAIIVIGAVKGQEIATYIKEKITSFDVRDSQHSISNRSRFGIQYSSFTVFQENPVLGVGYGMQAYEGRKKYPKWATVGNWEFRLKYLNENDPRFPPGYNIYTRLLAETGIIGILIFLLFLTLILVTTLRVLKKNDDRYLLAVVICISMVGFYFNWLKVDTIRVFGFWVNFALLLSMTAGSTFVVNTKKPDAAS
jgi:O-antigen ligase